jgi:hypothetical protein
MSGGQNGLFRDHQAGAAEALACVRVDNTPSIRLLESRHFERTGFDELVRSRGLARAAFIGSSRWT